MRKALWFLLLIFVSACGVVAGGSSEAQSDNRLVYGLTLQPSGIDPHIHQSSELGIPLRQVYDTLVYRDPTTKAFVPGLANDISISEDGLSYTFRLRQDVTFHDGTSFNAQAIAANLERIMNPASRSQRARFMLGTFSGYTVIDEYTIQLNLSEPFSPLLDSLSQVYLGMASPAALNEYSIDRYQFHQVGTGPFRFVEYIPGDRILLERNHDYAWWPAFYDGAAADGIEEIEYRFFTDPATRALALESGEAQIMGELLPTDARAFTGNSSIQLVPIAVPGQPLQFLMNTRRFPTDNRAFRQALLFGTNRNAIIDAIFQRFSPIAWGPISAATLYYSPEMNGIYAHDTVQAQSLLNTLGYQDTNNDGILEFGGLDIEVKAIVPPWGLTPETAQLLQDQWRTLGIRMEIETVPTFPALLDAISDGDYNLVAVNTFGLDPVFLNQYYMTGGSSNWTGYSNADLDNLLTEAARQTDDTIRSAMYAQVQRAIMNEALVIPIRDYVNLNASSASVQNLTYDPYGWFPLMFGVSLSG